MLTIKFMQRKLLLFSIASYLSPYISNTSYLAAVIQPFLLKLICLSPVFFLQSLEYA